LATPIAAPPAASICVVSKETGALESEGPYNIWPCFLMSLLFWSIFHSTQFVLYSIVMRGLTCTLVDKVIYLALVLLPYPLAAFLGGPSQALPFDSPIIIATIRFCLVGYTIARDGVLYTVSSHRILARDLYGRSEINVQ
jgi:hypothetical protein